MLTPNDLIEIGARCLRSEFPGVAVEQARWAADVVLKTFQAEWPSIELAAVDEDAGRSTSNYWWREARAATEGRDDRMKVAVTMAAAAGLRRHGMKDAKVAFAAATAIVLGILNVAPAEGGE